MTKGSVTLDVTVKGLPMVRRVMAQMIGEVADALEAAGGTVHEYLRALVDRWEAEAPLPAGGSMRIYPDRLRDTEEDREHQRLVGECYLAAGWGAGHVVMRKSSDGVPSWLYILDEKLWSKQPEAQL